MFGCLRINLENIRVSSGQLQKHWEDFGSCSEFFEKSSGQLYKSFEEFHVTIGKLRFNFG